MEVELRRETLHIHSLFREEIDTLRQRVNGVAIPRGGAVFLDGPPNGC